jgi:UDP-N-acetylmuramoylalanine--D-glutamate ligase
MEVRGRKIGVVGLAASGRSACRLLLREGAAVFGLDANPAAEPVPGAVMRLGPHDESLLDELDGLVVSPGVPAAIPFLQKALAKGLPVIGEIHLAAQFLTAPLLAITGTNGKSTTTHFLGQLVAATGARTFVGGNLGSPLCEAALAAVPPEVLVVEVSSYQMELPAGPSSRRPR